MKRRIIEIDVSRCDGCGICAEACHEGAIGIVAGKARLLRDDYCDGLGDCLPACPTGAISFVEREAAPYDEEAVLRAKAEREAAIGRPDDPKIGGGTAVGCAAQLGGGIGSGSVRAGSARSEGAEGGTAGLCSGQVCESSDEAPDATGALDIPSRLAQWPCQIRLVPERAPYFVDADLLVAADCTAFACPAFHERYMKGRTTIVGCPKLDPVDYSEKIAAIISSNSLRSITLARMEVPCCGRLQMAVQQALDSTGADIPFEVVTISIYGEVL